LAALDKPETVETAKVVQVVAQEEAKISSGVAQIVSAIFKPMCVVTHLQISIMLEESHLSHSTQYSSLRLV
jgi:hypothetical protein